MMRSLHIFIIVLLLITMGCGDRSNPQSQAMLSENLSCPEGSKGEIAIWGGIDSPGWAHSCKMNHGKYHVWKGEHLVIKGQFKQGKKDGVWYFKDDSGVTIKTVTYRDGVELKNNQANMTGHHDRGHPSGLSGHPL